MGNAAVRVRVNPDRTITVNLPDNLPVGEYNAILIPAESTNQQNKQQNSAESQQWDEKMEAAWEKLIDEVEQLPNAPQPATSEYHKSLIEKYKEKGLEL